jgi:hypothetical protein
MLISKLDCERMLYWDSSDLSFLRHSMPLHVKEDLNYYSIGEKLDTLDFFGFLDCLAIMSEIAPAPQKLYALF